MRRTSLLPLILFAAALVAGCGSGSKNRSASTTPATHTRAPWPKVAPDLWEILEKREREREAAIASGRTPPSYGPIQVVVAYTGEAGRLAAAGIPLGGLVSNSAQGGLTPEQIRAAVALDWVHMVSIPMVPQIQ